MHVWYNPPIECGACSALSLAKSITLAETGWAMVPAQLLPDGRGYSTKTGWLGTSHWGQVGPPWPFLKLFYEYPGILSIDLWVLPVARPD